MGGSFYVEGEVKKEAAAVIRTEISEQGDEHRDTGKTEKQQNQGNQKLVQ